MYGRSLRQLIQMRLAGYLASHAFHLAGLLWVFQLTGRLVAHVFPSLSDVGRKTGLILVSVGMVVWMYGLFVLATMQLLRGPLLIATMIAVIGIAVISILQTRLTASRAKPAPHTTNIWSRIAHGGAYVAIGVVLLALFVLALEPLL